MIILQYGISNMYSFHEKLDLSKTNFYLVFTLYLKEFYIMRFLLYFFIKVFILSYTAFCIVLFYFYVVTDTYLKL